MKNVFIFPAGTEIAFEILNALKYSKFVNIIGGTSVSCHAEFVFEKLISNMPNIDDENFMYKNDDGLEHTLGWSEEILAFYENALKENCQVIFTVDF